VGRERAPGRGVVACAIFLFAPLCIAQSPEPRPWNLSLRAFASHDSNVVLAADDNSFSGDSKSNVFGVGLSGDYRLYRDAQWTIGATGSLQQTYNGDSSLRDFNLTSFAPGLVARRAFRLNNRPAKLTLNYAARRDWIGGSGFASGHTASVDVGVRPTRETDIGVFSSVSSSNFDDEGPDPALSSRDAVSYRSGVRGAVGFNRNRQSLQGSVSYVKNDAKGANFVFEGPAAGVQFMSLVWGPWAVAASANYSKVDYTNFAVTPRRESTTHDYRVVLFGPLSRKLSADVSYSRSYYDSNQSAFEARRNNISVGLTYSY